jgi:FAD dependent oxidoreductase TIGR03364
VNTYNDVVIGAGIVGLAVAHTLAQRGRKVLVIERCARAEGASVRNFGMIWPIGQPAGDRLSLALRSREIWVNLLSHAGLWCETRGSLHAAYHRDEWQVLSEFATGGTDRGYDTRLVSADEARKMAPRLREDGLLGALYSATECCVDPREVVGRLPDYLGQFGTRFLFDCHATGLEDGLVRTSKGDFRADHIWLCSGAEIGALCGETIAAAGLRRCKLQMMRTAPLGEGEHIGPMLAAGLTLAHYTSFMHCPSLDALRRGLAERNPGYADLGIHVLVSQNATGQLTIGDSHEYDDAITPFDREDIDERILAYLGGFFDASGLRITERWHGIYVKHPTDPWTVLHPAQRLSIITGLGGAGMTLSFGLAERVVREVYG